ncbi:NUDIX domain-containing protein [Kitasatospora sp. NPDC085464]|uniref:NUDIX domain-containing protein n=1 Tax=Kitasatospora sp. NPDC085464 TaxID=3364063 RepID=UPI0037CA61A0
MNSKSVEGCVVAWPLVWARFLLRDLEGRTLWLRKAADSDRWDSPGGNVEHGKSPFATALRKTEAEIGLDLREVNPELIARQKLIAMIYQETDATRPIPSIGWVFDGGTITEEQKAGIVLDPGEHIEWRFETDYNWRDHMVPKQYREMLQVARAARSDTVLYLERPAPEHQDFEGIVVFVTTPEGELLMHHRDDKPGIAWPGFRTPIGGWREGDETPEETAAREVLEEAGITIAGVRPLPGPRHERVSPMTRVLHAVYTGPKDAIRLGDEGQGIAWVPFAEAAQLQTPPYVPYYLDRIATS